PRGGLRLAFLDQERLFIRVFERYGADLVKKEIADDVVVKIYSAAVGLRVILVPRAFATVRPGKPSCPGRTMGQDSSPVVCATRRITPESTVSPTPEMVWK